MGAENGSKLNGIPPADIIPPTPEQKAQEQREVAQLLSQLTGTPVSVSVLHEKPGITKVEFIIPKNNGEPPSENPSSENSPIVDSLEAKPDKAKPKQKKEVSPEVLEKRQRRSHNVSLHTGPLRRGERGWHENGRYHPPKEKREK